MMNESKKCVNICSESCQGDPDTSTSVELAVKGGNYGGDSL